MKIILTMLVAAVIVSVSVAHSADTTMRYGGWLQGSYDLHSANFSKFTDVGFCCPSDFGAQSGIGLRLGGMFEIAPLPSLSKDLLIDLRLGFGYTSAAFTTTEQTLFNDPSNGANEAVEASFDYIIAPTWMSASVDVLPTYRITSGLAAHLGVRGAFVFSDDYEQTEKVSDAFADQGFVFTDTDSPERNLASGPIPGMSTMAWSLVAGLSWEFPLNAEGTVFLAPELFASLGLNDVSNAVSHADGTAGSWSMTSVIGGISLRFSSVPTITPDPCDTIIDGVMQNKQCPDGQVLVFDPTTNDCRCKDTTTIVDSVVVRIESAATGPQEVIVESFKVRHWVPTLPKIFFGRNVSTLDLTDVYRDVTPQRRMTFDVEPSFQRDIYGHVLNIIGKRLFEQPEATIQIIGGHNSADGETDAVARDRAFAVRDYLYQRWGVSFDRMTVTSGGAGRNVDLIASTPDILAPVEMPSASIVIRPSSVKVPATIQPGASRSIASITYTMKVGGGAGRRPKPLTQTFNVGDPGFEEAQRGWSANIGDPNGRIYDAVKGQLDATDLVLMPSLEVVFTNGQKIAAEQDVRSTTLPVSILTPELKAQRGLPDTVELVIDVLDTAVVRSIFSAIPSGSTATIAPYEAGSATLARAVREQLMQMQMNVVDGPRSGPSINAPLDDMTSMYARSVRVIFRILRGG